MLMDGTKPVPMDRVLIMCAYCQGLCSSLATPRLGALLSPHSRELEEMGH